MKAEKVVKYWMMCWFARYPLENIQVEDALAIAKKFNDLPDFVDQSQKLNDDELYQVAVKYCEEWN